MRKWIRLFFVSGLAFGTILVFLSFLPLPAQAQEETLSLGEKPGVFDAEIGAFLEAADTCEHEKMEVVHDALWNSAKYDKNRYHMIACANPVCDDPPVIEAHLPFRRNFFHFDNYIQYLFTGAYHRVRYICRDCRKHIYGDFYRCHNQDNPECTECLEEIYAHLVGKADDE